MKRSVFNDLEIQRRKTLAIKELVDKLGADLQLDLRTAGHEIRTTISEPDIHRPGLAMAGFTDVYAHHSVQLLGTTEWSYLEAAGPDRRREIFADLARFDTPFWVLGQGLQPHQELLDMCIAKGAPLAVTPMSTTQFARKLGHWLEEWFAPFAVVHSSLVDVYGVGLLYVGASNIGKSECVLDLVERGHRLVADDAVKLTRIGSSIIGRGSSIINHHMEIRGVGVIDIRSMFGIHSVRKVKKVDIIVELQYWRGDVIYDRTGLDSEQEEIIGISIPRVVIPVSPGKNITVISEVIAMNALMKMDGVNTALEFDRSLQKAIQRKVRGEVNQEGLFDGDHFRPGFYE